MKSGSHYWKLLKTIPFAKLAFHSYSIQTALWLCSSAKWLPEREKSRFIQMSIDSISAKNIFYIQSLSKCPGNKRVPLTSLFIFMRENQVKALLQNVNSWPMHIPKGWVFELLIQIVNCPLAKMLCKSQTRRKKAISFASLKYIYIYIYIYNNTRPTHALIELASFSLRVQRHEWHYENLRKPWLFYKTNRK